MGNCCSSLTPDPSPSPRTGGDPQQPQPMMQRPEPPQNEPLPLPLRGRDTTPATPVKPNPTSPPSQPNVKHPQKPSRSGTSNHTSSSLPLRATAFVDPSFGCTRMGPPVTNDEAHPNPLHNPGGSIPLSSPRIMARSTSERPSHGPLRAPLASPSSSFKPRPGHIRGDRHQNGADLGPDPRLFPRATPKRAPTRGATTRSFPPTVREVLPDGFRFRILVLGKSQSGKSSLINAVFDVDMAAAPRSQQGNADINVGFGPPNNRYLEVHEYPEFEPGDAQSLQTIWDFISYRTDARCSVSERLHAIWICVPVSDAIERGLGEGVTKILGMKKVPVLIALTKFDLLVSRVQFDITRGVIPMHEPPGARARAMYEDLCHSLFHKDPKDVPAVIFSEKPSYRYLIGELTLATHRFIRADSHNPIGHPTSSQVQLPMIPAVIPELLAWSVAQRVDHDITIQASIEIGRSRYWRSLGSSQDFTDQALESCVNVIHEDIINVWNFDDREGYLLTADFTARMSHLVGDLAASQAAPAISPALYLSGTATPMAQWTNGPYQNANKNIRCMMAYIVDLAIILYRLFESRHSVSATNVQSVVRNYAESTRRGQIHDDIRSFVTQIPSTYQNRDTLMEKVIDLIKQNCVRTASQDSG